MTKMLKVDRSEVELGSIYMTTDSQAPPGVYSARLPRNKEESFEEVNLDEPKSARTVADAPAK